MISVLNPRRIVVLFGIAIIPWSRLAAQAPPLRVTLDSIVAPAVRFMKPLRVRAVDSSSAVVADPLGQAVRYVSTSANASRTIGGRGTAPGSYVYPMDVGWYHDSVWVAMFTEESMVVLPRDSGAGRTIHFDPPAVASGSHPTWRPIGLQRDGSLLMTIFPPPGSDEEALTPVMPVWVRPADGSGWRQVTSLVREPHRMIEFPAPSGFLQVVDNPFAALDMIAAHPDGNGFTIVRNQPVRPGARATLQFEFYDRSGQRIESRPITVPGPRADSSVDARVIQASIDDLVTRRKDLAPALVEAGIRSSIGSPTTRPAFSAFVIASDGLIWLRRFGPDADPTEWLRVNPATSEVMLATLPAGCGFGDALAGRLWLICSGQGAPVIRRAWLGER